MGANSIRKQIERNGHSPDWTCDVIRDHEAHGFEVYARTRAQFEELEYVLRHPEYMDKSKVEDVFKHLMCQRIAIDHMDRKVDAIMDFLGLSQPPEPEKAEPIVRRPGPCDFPDGEAHDCTRAVRRGT